MKSAVKLIVSGQLMLVVTVVKDRSTFGVYDFTEERLRFTQTVPRVRADAWSLSEELGLVACVGWENGMLSTFNAVDGIVKGGFKVPPDGDVLLHDDTIRICAKSTVHAFDLQGKRIASYVMLGERGKDFGSYIISKEGRRYELQDGYGKQLSKFAVEGVGITSAALLSEGIVVSEGGGPITCFDRTGQQIWQTCSPKEHHPIRVAIDINGDIYSMHARLPSLTSSMLTVQDPFGEVVAQQEIDFCPPVTAFLASRSMWITGSFHTFTPRNGMFERGLIGSLKTAFGLEDWQP